MIPLPAHATAASFLSIAIALSTGSAVSAQTPADELHGTSGPDIIVTAPFARDRFSLTTAASVLEGAALVRQMRPTIGETLASLPGVTASFFGPNASRPVLRGLDGERVRILTDGIGSFDVANTSPDHAVAINPLTAARVEVVRGPASLLYGSAAIGGVVNVTDRRLPRQLADDHVHLDVVGQLGSAARERSVGGHVDVPVAATGLVLHADGSWVETGDYRTGGYVFSRALREEAAHEGGEVAEQAAERGRIANSSATTREGALGLAWIGSGGSLAVAVSRLASDYGIPARLHLDHDHEDHHDHDDDEHDHAEHHGHDDLRIRMERTRIDARADLPLHGAFERLTFRFGWADYRHDEIEDASNPEAAEIGTSFFANALEARAELVQAERGGWRGASGVQLLSRRFEAVGAEAYIPLNQTDQIGLFTLQSVAVGAARLDLGGRYEGTSVAASPLGLRRHFDALSVSAGVSVPLGSGFRFSGSVAHTERAPAAEELFANGAHAATQSVEIGDPDLVKERSLGAEAVLRGRGEGWRIEVSGFFSRFSDFIALFPTGEEDHGLPVFAYQQAAARHWGLEAEAEVAVTRIGGVGISLTGLADFVRADLLGGRGPVPRIPPLRLLAGVDAYGGTFGGRLEVEHVTRQTRLAAFETTTPAFTLVNASLSFRPFGAQSPTLVMASVNNIFDVEARRHSSVLKDFAPLPGRDVRLSARLSF